MEARVSIGNAPVTPPGELAPELLRRLSYLSLFWLAARECLRVGRLWSQTVVAPVVSSLLFVIVFGLSLGDRIRSVNGFDYEIYILPGLVAMAMFMAAYMNNSSSIFQARSDRYIDDILAAPMRPWQIDVGLTVGGIFRALLIGGVLTAIGAPLLGVPIERPFALALAALAAILLFASLGVIVGIYAQTWDHHSFVSNLVIQPLAFVGGVFYSVDVLPSPWHELSHANPLFYLVDGVRYGFLGTSDVPVALSLGITTALAAAMFSWSVWLFRSGHKLKP
jgi:ABC-2 type transport system permease protein